LGLAWAIMQPLALNVDLHSNLFVRGADSKQRAPYAIFGFCRTLTLDIFFNRADHCDDSLVSHINLITKVYFPAEILPLTYVMRRSSISWLPLRCWQS